MTKLNRREGVYITDFSHFKDALVDPSTPMPAQNCAKFLLALIDASRNTPADGLLSTNIPCMAGPGRKWCLGLIKLSVDGDDDPEILWECPKCGKAGVIRNY